MVGVELVKVLITCKVLKLDLHFHLMPPLPLLASSSIGSSLLWRPKPPEQSVPEASGVLSAYCLPIIPTRAQSQAGGGQ